MGTGYQMVETISHLDYIRTKQSAFFGGAPFPLQKMGLGVWFSKACSDFKIEDEKTIKIKKYQW